MSVTHTPLHFIEIQAIGNYSLFLGDDDGICVAVLLQWKDLNLHYHNITVVPDTLFDIRHDSISIKVIYHTLYNVSVVHMCSGQDIIPLCIGLYYCESQQVYMMIILCVCSSLGQLIAVMYLVHPV